MENSNSEDFEILIGGPTSVAPPPDNHRHFSGIAYSRCFSVSEVIGEDNDIMIDIDEVFQILEEDDENANDDVATIDATEIVELGDEDETVEQSVQKANEGDIDDVKDMSGSFLGMTGSTIEDMYKMYCQHARANGFSVRRSCKIVSRKTGIQLAQLYLYSSAGVKTKNDETTRIKKPRKEKKVGITRTNCKALLSVKMNGEGIYEVVKHEMEHNHELSRPEWSHHHRSERKITEEIGKAIKQMISSGLKAAESYHYMVNEAGGHEDVGHTMRDHLNYVSRLKMEKIESGDAQTFIDMIQEDSKQDPEFFYRVKLDGEARLTNIFWRNSRMKEDYMIYGDVVVFDTTYMTNKYNLICAPFVGINNHWKNVMFGCAFISDEKTETFEWLFKVFRKSMEWKQPITIFTDQDLTIAKGIKMV